MYANRIAVLLVILALLTSTTLPTIAHSAPNNDDPLAQDAKVYAADQNIDLTEAFRRLRLQPTVGALSAELDIKERDSFAGLWIQHSPQFRIVVQLTSGGEKRFDHISNTGH
jgi:hypothetical protein